MRCGPMALSLQIRRLDEKLRLLCNACFKGADAYTTLKVSWLLLLGVRLLLVLAIKWLLLGGCRASFPLLDQLRH